MPSPVAHSMFSFGMYVLLAKTKVFSNSYKYLLPCLIVGMFSDIDFLFILLGAGIHLHRGFTHSIVFSIGAAFIFSLSFIFKKEIGYKKVFLFLLTLTLGHLLLDYLTVDEYMPAGIKLFWPWGQKYFQSPYCIFLGFDWTTLRGAVSFSTLLAVLVEVVLSLPFVLLALLIDKSKK